ncbi:MAG: hypothetical protein V3U51_06355 [Thermoplasmata archaeon]
MASVGDKKTGQMRRDGEQVEDRCQPDYAVAGAFSSKTEFRRKKSLMEWERSVIRGGGGRGDCHCG